MLSWDSDPQGSDGWHLKRQLLLTGSNAQTIASSADGHTSYVGNVARAIVNGPDMRTVQQYKSKEMQAGNDNEPLARAAAERDLGLMLRTVGICTNTEWRNCGASLDAIDIGMKIGVEIKCPIEKTMTLYELKPEKFLRDYRRQCAMQMIVAELDVMFLYAWSPVPGAGPAIIELNRNSIDWNDEICEMEESLRETIIELDNYIEFYERKTAWLEA